ncbi:YccJ family protein [Salmonella enterica]
MIINAFEKTDNYSIFWGEKIFERKNV